MDSSPKDETDLMMTMMMMMQMEKHPHQISPNVPDLPPFPEFYNPTGGDNPRTFPSDLSGDNMAAMREMIFRVAVMQPVEIDPETIRAPRRRNVRISKDPQSVAARHRRERISERIRILQRLVPGGTKMDTASMLDEAIHYVKFLKTQVQTLENAAAGSGGGGAGWRERGFEAGMGDENGYGN